MSEPRGEIGATTDTKPFKMESTGSGRQEWKPPVFSKTEDDVQRYFRQFKRVARANSWSEERQLSVLPALFVEEAEWVADELEKAIPATVEQAEELAVKLLCPKEKRKVKLHLFYEARLVEHDEPRKFVQDLRQLLRAGMPDLNAGNAGRNDHGTTATSRTVKVASEATRH